MFFSCSLYSHSHWYHVSFLLKLNYQDWSEIVFISKMATGASLDEGITVEESSMVSHSKYAAGDSEDEDSDEEGTCRWLFKELYNYNFIVHPNCSLLGFDRLGV